jgi:metal-responsive CopG/Arc/MetJ family transcriptional regulator
MSRGYTTVSIPDELIGVIEETIRKRSDLGYRNRSEFIIEAIREKLMDLKREGK